MSEKAETNLLEGILADSEKKAAELVEAAKRDAEKRKASAESQAEAAAEGEINSREERLRAFESHAEGVIHSEERRIALKQHDRLINLAMEEVKKNLSTLSARPDYQEIMAGWIAEAALGLGKSEALVSFSREDRIDEKTIASAEKIYKNVTGNEVRLHLSGRRIQGAGVIVSSLDGRSAYNNQVSQRLGRYEREVREILEKGVCRTK